MAEGYLYACQRAELLGESPPTEEEWAESQKCERDEQEDFGDNTAQNLDMADEGMTRISGGLDELNTILNATQKKINRFKTACSSLGTILKVRVISSRNRTPDHKPFSSDNETTNMTANDETIIIEDNIQLPNLNTPNESGSSIASKTSDINDKVASHIDKLDSLITKSENAQYSMQHQTKQMKKIMK